jgi:hypothetical protein
MAGFPRYQNVNAPDLSNLIQLQSQGASNAFNSLANIGNTIQGIQQKNIDRDNRNLLAQAMQANLNQDPNAVNNIISQNVDNTNLPLNQFGKLIGIGAEQKKNQQNIAGQQNLLKVSGLTDKEKPVEVTKILEKSLVPIDDSLLNEGITANTANLKNQEEKARQIFEQGLYGQSPTNVGEYVSTYQSISDVPLSPNAFNFTTKTVQDVNQNRKDIADQQLSVDLALKTPLEIANSGDNLFKDRTTPLPESVVKSLVDTRKQITADKNLIQGAKLLTSLTDTLNPENTATNVNQTPENLLVSFGFGKEASDIILKGPQISQEEQNKEFDVNEVFKAVTSNVPIFTSSQDKSTNNNIIGPKQPSSLTEALSIELAPLSKIYTDKVTAIRNNNDYTDLQKTTLLKQENKNYTDQLAIASANLKRKYSVPDEDMISLFNPGTSNNLSTGLNSTNSIKTAYGTALNNLPPSITTGNPLLDKPENSAIKAEQSARETQSFYNKSTLENSKLIYSNKDEIKQRLFKNVLPSVETIGKIVGENTEGKDVGSATKLVSNLKEELQQNPYFKKLNKEIDLKELGAIMLNNASAKTTFWGFMLGDGLGDDDSYFVETDDLTKATYIASQDPNFKGKYEDQKSKVIKASNELENLNTSLGKLESRLLSEREANVNTLKTEEEISKLRGKYIGYLNDFTTVNESSKNLVTDYLKSIGYVVNKNGKFTIKKNKTNAENVNKAKQISVPIAQY